ncbi:nucleotidyltransferase family protein [Schnuerera sp.]|uniref:nucleotidyltransferase family protein n=1 Tax=Schnuerera sp. TaxID=2794844 RepID=UPI002D14DA38|nr:nucleotidyltransferase family protein [Schnuerera sp.]HSH36327.1 nucleotidyltransferase family protein [Schnuerera sp.]
MITGIIMAAGFSKRMGEDKLLMEIDGVNMVERVIGSCKNSILDEIILIYRKEEVGKIGEKHQIKTAYNPNAHLGQSESMKLGIKATKTSDAYMFLTGDQPFVTSELIDRLIDEYKKSEYSIVVPYYNGRNGTPTIFSSIYKEELLEVEGDKGGRDIIKKNISSVKKVIITDEKLGFDVDTPKDFKGVVS